MKMELEKIMQMAPVIPVLVIEDPRHAKPIAQALVDGGLYALEVTLRTPAALEVISEISTLPKAIVGAGTVLNDRQLHKALQAGAEFIVSPGLTRRFGEAAIESKTPYLPGIANASQIMLGFELGLSHFKFFPASSSGGVEGLKALTGPFSEAKFCPTGGIRPENASLWLEIDQVLCVGGTWLVPSGAPDLGAIEAAARTASALA
jgi:2-dehydro-3-deoxyphosphogluconate aldolase / (4S)-4-hydroxy-2-oxoglutarate aldolase